MRAERDFILRLIRQIALGLAPDCPCEEAALLNVQACPGGRRA